MVFNYMLFPGSFAPSPIYQWQTCNGIRSDYVFKKFQWPTFIIILAQTAVESPLIVIHFHSLF